MNLPISILHSLSKNSSKNCCCSC